MTGRVSLADAARAVLAARAGGPAVVVVARADADAGDSGGAGAGDAGAGGGGSGDAAGAGGARSGGARVLVFADGRALGTLGDRRLDEAAREIGARLLDSATDTAWTLESDDGNTTLYAEAHAAPARLFVVGAGHIAVPLARLGDLLGFPVVVLDDRDGFATDERFPDAVRVERVDFRAPFRDRAPGPADLVVLVTRAHRYDYDCLRALLDGESPPAYIGMVGSQRRVRAAFRALLDAGVPEGRLAAIHAPIGVDIGAETPEEIAVSIAAELVAARRGVEAKGSLRDTARVVERLL